MLALSGWFPFQGLRVIEKIEAGLAERWEDISRWFQEHLERAPAPVYASVDIRNSGFKLSVVDTNLFPAGFNNLCQRCFVNGPELFRKYFQERYGQVQNILIVPEDHTRNLPYFANVARITSILLKAGYNVRVGFVSADLRDDIYELILPSGETVCLYRIFRQDSQIWVEDFRPDLLLINNDFTTGTGRIERDSPAAGSSSGDGLASEGEEPSLSNPPSASARVLSTAWLGPVVSHPHHRR